MFEAVLRAKSELKSSKISMVHEKLTKMSNGNLPLTSKTGVFFGVFPGGTTLHTKFMFLQEN